MVILSKAGLVSAYVLIGLLLLSALLYTKWPWRLKALTIALVSAFYVITYFSFPPLFGWPTDEPMPKRFNLVAIYVQEPNKSSGDEGEIFLWATNLENGPTRQEPRSYRLPFSGELHSKVVEAGTKMRKGLPQLGEIVEKNLGPHGKPTDEDQGGQKSIDIDFFDLPDPLFPEK